jgi:hypothetical protein
MRHMLRKTRKDACTALWPSILRRRSKKTGYIQKKEEKEEKEEKRFKR